MLRDELAGRVAERLQLDGRLLRQELRRAASEGRGEVRVQEEMTAGQTSHAVKQLLRLCLESSEIADAILPELLESGVTRGLAAEGVFRRLREARDRGESLDVASEAGGLSETERKLVYEALFWPGDPPNLELAKGALRALRCDKLVRELQAVQREIERTQQEGDKAKETELKMAKLKLRKELEELTRPQKNPPPDKPSR
jgi:uncharacterized protein YdcH (DUF465 family)